MIASLFWGSEMVDPYELGSKELDLIFLFSFLFGSQIPFHTHFFPYAQQSFKINSSNSVFLV